MAEKACGVLATMLYHSICFLSLHVVVVAVASPALPQQYPRTFSYTFKPGQALEPNKTLVLCNHVAKTPSGNHAVLISWFTGQLMWDHFGATIISYYIDGESEPSIRASIDMLTGEGPAPTTPMKDRKIIPWGSASLGRVGIGGGAYTTTRIPFAKSVKVTAEMAPGGTQSEVFCSVVRGLENYGPISLRNSGVKLAGTSRLKSFYVNTTLKSTEWATLANVTSGSGAILQVVQHVRSVNSYCLEGTHWARINTGANATTEDLQLSSWFEDYYLSGQYFDAGEFATALSGMTAEDHWFYPHALTAYRLHEADPVMFSSGIALRWQNGMKATGKLAAGTTNLESLVLVYVDDETMM